MRHIDFGRILFVTGIAGLGILSLVFGKFALQWQPVPAWAPDWLAYVNGGLLLVCAVGPFLEKRLAAAFALALLAYLAFWVVVQVIYAAPHPFDVGAILPLFEDMVLMCGACLAYVSLKPEGRFAFLQNTASLKVLRILFGVSCLIFGLSHFVYADFTAQMVPAFLPYHLPLAYLTGAGHLATGLALVSGILPRLAAMCEAGMMSSFVVLVHIPMVIAPAPEGMTQLFWTMLFAACGLSGSAWLLSRSSGGVPEVQRLLRAGA